MPNKQTPPLSFAAPLFWFLDQWTQPTYALPSLFSAVPFFQFLETEFPNCQTIDIFGNPYPLQLFCFWKWNIYTKPTKDQLVFPLLCCSFFGFWRPTCQMSQVTISISGCPFFAAFLEGRNEWSSSLF